jgi:hypothetical protein
VAAALVSRGRGLAVVAAVAMLVVIDAPAPVRAAGSSVTSIEVRDLARRAEQDPAALDRLRQVQAVDGRPADLAAALQGVSGDDLHRRLETLANGDVGAPAEPGASGTDPRVAARDVLGERRFHPPRTPRPLLGVFRRIGGWLEPVLRPLGRWLRPVGRFLAPVGRLLGRAPVLVAVAALAVALTAFVVSRLIRRRSQAVDEGAGPFAVDGPLDPHRLEREADAAEAAGDLAHAFRLRFTAGLLRLDRAGALRFRPSLTTGEVVRTVPSASLRPLAVAFDEIAYGGRPTERADLDALRSGFPRVLHEAGHR